MIGFALGEYGRRKGVARAGAGIAFMHRHGAGRKFDKPVSQSGEFLRPGDRLEVGQSGVEFQQAWKRFGPLFENVDGLNQRGMRGYATPALEAGDDVGERILLIGPGGEIEFVAERSELAIERLAHIHQRAAKAGAHLFGGGGADCLNGTVLQHGQQRQHRNQPTQERVPTKVLRPGQFHARESRRR